jgi:hypothetical protein
MFALMLSLLLTQTSEPASPPQARVLPVAEVQPDQVNFESGATVLALCGKELKQVQVTVKDIPAQSDIVSTPPMKALSVPCEAELLFYKIPTLKPGAVHPSFEVKWENPLRGHLSSGTPLSFSVKGKDYKVVSENGKPPAFRVFMADGEKKYLLYDYPEDAGKEGDATLLWAGDLNQDGSPDVILMAGGETRSMTLFMSTRGSKWPRPAATYEYSSLD